MISETEVRIRIHSVEKWKTKLNKKRWCDKDFKMNSDKQKQINLRVVPSIQIDSPISSNRQSYISVSSSEESIPIEAPLARQIRCDVDIDTVSPKHKQKAEVNGFNEHSNSYLDNSELRESIKDIA